MSEAAREIQTTEPVSLDGLEQLFDTTPNSEQGDDQGTPIKIANGDVHGAHATLCNPDHWTLQEAADQLGLSMATIRRRLTKCQLQGYKVQGVNGPEWRVIPPTQTATVDQDDPDQFVEHPDPRVISALLARLSDVESQLKQAQIELQGANWRNGYLESQLENHREQIKLLTDSQHRPGWWARFKKWCAAQ
jgi:predicted ArsR family transcriptional regulator